MKVIMATSIVPTTIFIISFLTIIIYFFITMQFVYAQTVENEIIENTLERVDNTTTAGISELTESLNSALESTEDNTITSDISKEHNQSEFKMYESKIIGVKFKMPSRWDISVEINNTNDCFFYDEIYKIFLSNCRVLLNNNASYPYDFNIEITKHSTSNYSLVDFLTLVYEDIKHLNGFTFIDDKEMTIQNNPAWQIEYSVRIPGFLPIELKQLYIATKVNNTFYSLTFGPTNSSVYSKYLPEFENFVKSIEFIPSIKPEEIEPIEPIKLKPSFLKYSTLENITNNNEIIEQTQGSKITTSNNIIADLLFDKYYPIVKVAYESDSMAVLEAKENYLSEINGSLVPFWESMDVVKNQGYSLNEITTLGTGSIENPIIFYAIFFNNSNNKLEK